MSLNLEAPPKKKRRRTTSTPKELNINTSNYEEDIDMANNGNNTKTPDGSKAANDAIKQGKESVKTSGKGKDNQTEKDAKKEEKGKDNAVGGNQGKDNAVGSNQDNKNNNNDEDEEKKHNADPQVTIEKMMEDCTKYAAEIKWHGAFFGRKKKLKRMKYTEIDEYPCISNNPAYYFQDRTETKFGHVMAVGYFDGSNTPEMAHYTIGFAKVAMTDLPPHGPTALSAIIAAKQNGGKYNTGILRVIPVHAAEVPNIVAADSALDYFKDDKITLVIISKKGGVINIKKKTSKRIDLPLQSFKKNKHILFMNATKNLLQYKIEWKTEVSLKESDMVFVLLLFAAKNTK